MGQMLATNMKVFSRKERKREDEETEQKLHEHVYQRGSANITIS